LADSDVITKTPKPAKATDLNLDENATHELYLFDSEAADAACNFIECLRHVSGPLAGERFLLAPWQRQHTRSLFGWKRKDNGKRRFQVAYIEVPRKNGKTTWAAAIALYMTFADGEQGGQVYSAAKDLEQACLCYDTALAMVEDHPFLSQVAKIRKMPKSINDPTTRTKYKPLAGKSIPGTGFSPSGIIFDELHEQSDRLLWDKLQSGRGARSQPLTVALTTAGFDRSSVCWTLHQKARDIIDGKAQDDKFYPVIYAADEDDDWTDPDVWRKANPNFGTSMRDDYLFDEFETTKTEPDYVNTFRRWYLNQWTGQDKQWISLHEWDDGAEDERLWDEFAGRPCWCGLDLSNVRDATAFVMVFHDHRFEPVDGRRRYVALPTIWTPRTPGTKRDAQDTRQLQNWALKGSVRTDAGEKDISMDSMEEHICTLREKYDIEEIAFDPYHARGLVESLENRGFAMAKFAQTPANYTQGCKELEVLIGRGDLRHDGNECMRWMVGNAAKREDSSGNIKPDKGASGDKIDGLVSLIMGLSLAMRVNQGSMYETPGAMLF
jgi:phage terminase large subunit-like protein